MSDCMTQEEAERMDASQAVQILKPLQAMMLDQYGCPISDAYFALGKAIEALKQQTVCAVPVVRCRDCKYYVPVPSFTGESQMGCEFFKVYDMDDDDYCSRGGRNDSRIY